MTEPEKPFTGPGGSDATAASELDEAKAARNANRFDIRRLIGGLFLLYGVILTILGVVGSSEVKHKASGINIDLWTGIGLLVFGGLMVFWALARPVAPQRSQKGGQGPGQIRRAPAT